MSDTLARRALAAVHSLVSRGRIVSSGVTGNRTVIDAKLLSGEARQALELLWPMGFSARPTGGDILSLQITPDHHVALGGDDPALRIADLEPGEFGFRDARGTQIVWRVAGLEIASPLPVTVTSSQSVTMTAPAIALGSAGGAVAKLVTDALVDLFNNHTHSGVQAGGGVSGPPKQPMGASHLTQIVKAG